jgi:glucoamylase
VRYGVRKAGDPLIEDSLRVIDAVLKVETPYGPAWRRYNYDGYGPHADGSAYTGWGIGRPWPLLTGERAHYELAAGRDVRPLLTAMERFASEGGLLPEQVWDQPDLPVAGMYLGKPSGSAMPLVWAHAEYIKLLRSVHDGQVFDLIPIVAQRYGQRLGRRDLEIWKSNRRVRSIAAGSTLRIVLSGEFRLRWSNDSEQSMQEVNATATGLGLSLVDLPTSTVEGSTIRFTLHETGNSQLEESVHEVLIRPSQRF